MYRIYYFEIRKAVIQFFVASSNKMIPLMD